MTCDCTPTQALDKIQQTLIGRHMRVVGALSPALRERLADLADSFLDEESDELESELSKLVRDASRGLCIHCGSYEKCPCDDMADQQATEGY